MATHPIYAPRDRSDLARRDAREASPHRVALQRRAHRDRGTMRRPRRWPRASRAPIF